MLGEYYTEDDSELARLAAMQYYIEYGSEISEEGLTALLKSYIPESILQVCAKTTQTKIRNSRCKRNSGLSN